MGIKLKDHHEDQLLYVQFLCSVLKKKSQFQLRVPTTTQRQFTISYLNDSWVLRQRTLRFWGLTDSEVFDITPPEDNVLKDFISRWYWTVCWSVFCTEGSNW